MKVKGYILCICLALTAVAGYGQKTDRGQQALQGQLVCQGGSRLPEGAGAESQVGRCHVQFGECADDAGKG